MSIAKNNAVRINVQQITLFYENSFLISSYSLKPYSTSVSSAPGSCDDALHEGRVRKADIHPLPALMPLQAADGSKAHRHKAKDNETVIFFTRSLLYFSLGVLTIKGKIYNKKAGKARKAICCCHHG